MASIKSPKPHWRPLYLGPIHFRAYLDQGEYKAGTPLDEMASWFQHSDAGHLSIEEATGAIVITWLSENPDQQVQSRDSRFFGDMPGSYHLAEIDKARSEGRQSQIAGVNEYLSLKARNLYCGAVSLRNRLTQEFLYAVEASLCRVQARPGKPTADFVTIPPDIFRRYSITSWGYGVSGGGEAELEGNPKLFAIHLETVVRKASAKKGSRAATPQDLTQFQKHFAGKPAGLTELDHWRKQFARDVSRDSLRDLFRDGQPDLRRGPRGPRQKSAE